MLLESLAAQRGYTTGKLTSIRLSPLDDAGVDRTPTGRVKYIILSGEAGAAKISGSELQDLLGLNSTLFDIETVRRYRKRSRCLSKIITVWK